jgi:hypothetical protein
MFCPLCRTEYREGFTTCSDCHVALVAQVPEDDEPGAYHVLWKGENPEFQSMLVEELDSAKIGCTAIPLDLLFRNSRDFVDVQRPPLFGLAVCVSVADYPAAKRILEDCLGTESNSEPSAPQETPEAPEVSLVVPDVPLDWDESTATLELWRGNREPESKFLCDSLRGVGIPSRQQTQPDGATVIFVRPEDAERAREIVREVTENAAPTANVEGVYDLSWKDEPVRSYTLLLAIGIPWFLLLIFIPQWRHIPEPLDVFFTTVAAIVMFISNFGTLWMIYQAVRYEVRPLRFVILSFLPLSFIWYYHERYKRRRKVMRLPIAIRLRIPPPSA